MRNLLTAFPPLIAHCIFHCIFNISTVKPHEFVKFVSVRLFFALYVVDPHQDFYMRIAMRISAYADHPHEPHGSATAWPTLVHNGGDGDGVIFIKHPQEEEYERGHWGSKAEFLLSCIGYSVGIGWLPKKIIIMITISFV